MKRQQIEISGVFISFEEFVAVKNTAGGVAT